MKRVAATIVLALAVTTLFKVATKVERAPELTAQPAAEKTATPPDATDLLLARHPDDPALVARVADRYQLMALQVDQAAGLPGLRLLDKLDMEAIFLFEKHPREFQKLASAVGDDAAADLLLHWRSYFGFKRADNTYRPRLIGDIAALPRGARRLAGKYPAALPLILAAPQEVRALVARLEDDPPALAEALSLLDLVSLESGPQDLKAAIETLERHPALGLGAFRARGPEGFALVRLYGEILERLGDSVPLDEALIILQVNSADVDSLLQTRTASQLAAHVRHVASQRLAEAVGSGAHGLRLSIEFGDDGDRALAQAGGDAADIVYEDYQDPLLRRQAALALARFGPMAAAMLAKYSQDSEFQAILARDGADIIPPIARADVNPELLLSLQQKARKSFTEELAAQVIAWSGENGQSTIHTIHNDGLGRVAEIHQTDLQFYQFLPLYDLLHLGKVMTQGHAPTSGEVTWAAIDAAFVVWDVLSLIAAQPGATAAGEAVRGEVKATVKQAAKLTAREGVQAVAAGATRAARWWAVRAGGGLFQVLKRTPEAISRMSVEQITRMAAPLCRKAGIKLSTWTPLRFIQNGAAVLVRVPAERWVKYVAVNGAQAGVGVIAIHKMEEYLSSRRGPQQ